MEAYYASELIKASKRSIAQGTGSEACTGSTACTRSTTCTGSSLDEQECFLISCSEQG
jgi:hypothetical protein